MKKKSNKLAKLEKNRFSLFHDGKRCMICNSSYQLTWHELFEGSNRQNSMRYGLCIRLCFSCHCRLQEDKAFKEYWQKKGQTKFNEVYPNLDFISIFHRNYL